MIVETIQMARVEGGPVELDKQRHTLDDLVHSALDKQTAEAGRLEIDLPAGLPDIAADAELVRMVIRQIVGNAFKYSRPGTPIRLAARGQQDSAIVSVTDSGPGIPHEEQGRIFEKFYRGQNGPGHPSGMGMGLPIARQIVEAHGGRMWVDSQPGEGSTFSFTLPFARDADG
jgi:signal transduction histidine kinase